MKITIDSATGSEHGNGEKGENSLVGAVNVIDSKNSQVTVVTEITEGDASTGLELLLVDNLLASIEGNGHGEHIAIGKAVFLTDTMHIVSCRCYRFWCRMRDLSFQ